MKDLSVFCGKVFAVASLKPAKLMSTSYLFILEMRCIVLILFVLRRLDSIKLGLCRKSDSSTRRNLASKLHISLLTALPKKRKANTIGETLVKPCALKMNELVCGTKQTKKLKTVPLSNDTVRPKITNIFINILEQVNRGLKVSPFPFSTQLDQNTDISDCAQLCAYV